jgi:hypothetical protein
MLLVEATAVAAVVAAGLLLAMRSITVAAARLGM